MEKIEFTAHYGDDKKNVCISASNGAAGVWHIYMDKYYYGVLLNIKGEWAWRPQNQSDFTSDDIQILGEMIEMK